MVFRNILIPTEFDEISAKATHFAVRLAEQLNIHEVTLVSLIVPPQDNMPANHAGEEVPNYPLTSSAALLAKNKQSQLAAETARRYSTSAVRVNPKVRFNSDTTHLNAFIDEFDADLVVAGSRDDKTLLEKFMGSETQKIIRHTSCPLIIVNKASGTPQISEITLALDVHDKEQSGAEAIISFAQQMGAKLQLLHVICDHDNTEPGEAIQCLNRLAGNWSLDNYGIHVVNSNSLEDGLRKFIRKYNPDMLAVLTQGKHRLNTLLFGNDTETIMNETDKPVMINKIT